MEDKDSRAKNSKAAIQKLGIKAAVIIKRLAGICVNTIVLTSPMRLASQKEPT